MRSLSNTGLGASPDHHRRCTTSSMRGASCLAAGWLRSGPASKAARMGLLLTTASATASVQAATAPAQTALGWPPEYLTSLNSATVTMAAMERPAAEQHPLEALPFDNSFVRELPGDPDKRNVVRQVTGALYSRVEPTPAAGEPRLVSYSRPVAELVGLDPTECERPEFPLIFGGAAPLPGAASYAQCYGGHQFRQWAGQLGDGRAITLGEVLVNARPDRTSNASPASSTPYGSTAAPEASTSGAASSSSSHRQQRWELQLKGAGKTPYSRRADGRAVLRSSLREFVCSEAMAALGVPTTRALSLVATGDAVLRDMFYNGNARLEPGAVVCRVAPSFVRLGTFQLPASRGGGEEVLTKQVADYVIRHHYPELLHTREHPSSSTGSNNSNGSGEAVASQQEAAQPSTSAGMDNKSAADASAAGGNVYVELLREVCRRTGVLVALWQSVGFVHGVLNSDNCSILGITIDYGPFGFLDKFDPEYTPNLTDYETRIYDYKGQPESVQFNLVMFANALIAADLVGKEEAEAALLTYSEALSNTYNARMAARLGFSRAPPPKELSVGLLRLMYQDGADFTNAFRALSSVPSQPAEGESSAALPPALRAAIPEEALTPEREQAWLAWLATYQAALRAQGVPDGERAALQNSVNPKFIPRQHLLQWAIEAAERGEYSELEALMEVVTRPYDDHPGADPKFSRPPPPELVRPGVCVLSCSS